MDDLYTQSMAIIEEKLHVQPVALPDELAGTTFPLKAVDLQCCNWKSEKVRKQYCMRMKVRVPSLDILGMAIHPDIRYDAPIFIFDLSCTRKVVVTYINLIGLSDDPSWAERYIAPARRIAEKYSDFAPHSMPEWMQAYHSACTVYSMPPRSRLEDIKRCVIEYVELYTGLLASTHEITDTGYRKKIEDVHQRFREDLLTKDRSQKMLAKIIGRKKASRIFHEVLV